MSEPAPNGMKLIHGSTRLILLCGNFVFKIPHPKPLLVMLELQYRVIRKWEWRKLYKITSVERYYLWLGLHQNQTEYRCWKQCRAPFLAPVYFSIGILNVQKRICGEHPDQEDMSEIRRKINGIAWSDSWVIDQHHFSRKNYIRTPQGCIIVDYGDSEKKIDFTALILKWHEGLTAILMK